MPIHDWTRVEAGTFHAFRFSWVAAICTRLNHGTLPAGYYAMLERDQLHPKIPPSMPDPQAYSMLADRIAVRHKARSVVAVLEIVSPGNRSTRKGLRAFVDRCMVFLQSGVHLLIVDPFPSGGRDGENLHNAIWRRLGQDPTEFQDEKPLKNVAYSVSESISAYVEPFALGDRLGDMPLFLTSDTYINVPLEVTYLGAWDAFPTQLKELLE